MEIYINNCNDEIAGGEEWYHWVYEITFFDYYNYYGIRRQWCEFFMPCYYLSDYQLYGKKQ